MDVLELLILALRLLLVAVLYAFLVLVLRFAARGLSADRPVATHAMASRLRLVVLEPGASHLAAGQVLEVDDGTTMGRAQRADLVVEDPSVSAEHARVARVGRAWVVADLGSTNGTRVNSAKVSGSTPLADGDELALGAVRLQVLAR